MTAQPIQDSPHYLPKLNCCADPRWCFYVTHRGQFFECVNCGALAEPDPALDVASLRQDQGGICAIGEVGSLAHGRTMPGAGNHDDGLTRQKESADRSLTDA